MRRVKFNYKANDVAHARISAMDKRLKPRFLTNHRG